ncbi:MAG: hypothetical protein WC651_03495, partial [Candidatus Gracilibacteria bacterium]
TYNEKECLAVIAPCEKLCESIALVNKDTKEKFSPNSPALITEKNKKLSLSLETKDNQNAPLPPSTKLDVNWNTGGTMTDNGKKENTSGSLRTTIEKLPLIFFGADKDGKITVTLDKTDILYTPEKCKAELSIQGPLTCTETNVDLKKYSGTKQETSLVPNEIYTVNAKTQYSKTSTNNNVFSVNEEAGTIVELNTGFYKIMQQTLLNNLKSANNLTKAKLRELKFEIVSSKTLPNNSTEILYFVTYSDTIKSITNALTVNAENFSSTASCTKTFPLTYTAPPTPTEPVCESLNIETPNRPWDPTGKKELFEIDVTTTPRNEEKNLTYVWEVVKGDGEWSNEEAKETEKGSLKNTLSDAENNTTVKVYALDNKTGKEVERCSDTIKAKTEKAPEMTKSVYVTGTTPTTKDLLNIGSSTKKDVTYRIQFAANSAQEVDIRESAMHNGQILGDKDGNLSYLGMIINVTEGGDKYTILRDGRYVLEAEDSKFKDSDFARTALQDKHNCEKGTQRAGTSANKVCIANRDFAQTVANFKAGENIQFKNLDENTVIEIKVQMKNNTKITSEYCKKLTAADGCGEQFKNTAKFDATMPDKEIEKGSASAKVIVICPYVLTRQAGDVFFHDVLDTGIDVSRCSEVKSTPGVVIQPEKVTINKITRTGTGDLPTDETEFLDVPSHDICRYSNTKGAQSIEGYNDILNNFSSTICEMRADVAETWKETYINESIKANVERISRFGENLTLPEINDITQLSKMDNAKSGVFVKNGDLTIGTIDGIFTVEGKDTVPAGQTYIIKGGTLTISSNVEYGATDYINPKKIPSAAFIVIDGNIVIDNRVSRIDAIIMAIDTDNKGNDGKITNVAKNFDRNNPITTDKMLVINGSLIGNVSELFATRTGAGDPAKDEGAVTIRYDERILLNTPPGLSDLLNVTQSLIPGGETNITYY